MWHATFGSGAEKLTARISRFTLNDVTRKYEALRKKEEEGWYTGSIAGVAFVICHLEDKPTFAEVAKEAKEKLVEMAT